MGTDIHAVFQTRKGDLWQDVSSTWEQDRHYALFAWLANVRNGFGFAGVPTHAAIKPIAEPRGLPADFEMDGESHPIPPIAMTKEQLQNLKEWPNDYGTSDGRYGQWMGDHTHSWLMLDKILAAERPGTLKRVGVVPRSFYESWDGKTAPDEWSGDISGPGIVVIDQPKNVPHTAVLPEMITHVRIRFDTPDGLDYFVDEIKRLREEHGPDTRLVFGFDS